VTIAKGRPWGAPGRLPADGVVVRTDAEAGRIVSEARRAGTSPPVIGLLGGDLCRTLGGTGDEARLLSERAVIFPIDIASVTVDGHQQWFVAHVVAHNRLWTRGVAALNAQWIGEWNIGPRGHPDDGRLDVYEARLTLGDVPKVRARLPTGSHLPHPRIRERRVVAADFTWERPLPVWVDGARLPGGAVRQLSVRIEPDGARVVI